MYYWASETIESFMKVLDQQVDFVSRVVLAASYEGRPITALRLRRGPATQRDGALLLGGMHARELLPPNLLCDFALGLIEHQYSDWKIGGRIWPSTTIRLILDTLDIFILPNANPDGREYVLSRPPGHPVRLWRKNRRKLPLQYPEGQCYGVDLNRNFDLLWGIETLDSPGKFSTSRDPCFLTYCGPKAFSEVETRNVRNLVENHPITCMVDIHSAGERIFFPWGHAPNQTTNSSQNFTEVDTSDWEVLPTDAPNYRENIPIRDLLKFEFMALDAANAIEAVRGRGYLQHEGARFYPATGTSSDWAYSRHIVDPGKRVVWGFTFEIGEDIGFADDGVPAEEKIFQPDPSLADPIKKDIFSGLLSILQSCVCGVVSIGSDAKAFEVNDFASIRDLRDRRLAGTAAGREWIGLFEKNQFELALHAANDPGLRSLGGEIIAAAGKLLRDDERTSRQVAAKAAAFVKRLSKRRISSGLRRDLAKARPWLARLAGRRPSEIVGDMTARPPGSRVQGTRRSEY